MSSQNTNLIQTLKIGLIWMLIATGIYFIVAYIEKKEIANRISFTDQTIEIKRFRDGHYYWTGSINGHPVTFLIDTGASITSIPENIVQQAGLPLGQRIQLQTANGVRDSHIVKGDLCLEGGVCINNLSMTVTNMKDDFGLLGMNVINKMTWSQTNNVMRFESPNP